VLRARSPASARAQVASALALHNASPADRSLALGCVLAPDVTTLALPFLLAAQHVVTNTASGGAPGAVAAARGDAFATYTLHHGMWYTRYFI
jgi:hypothetical protein